MSIDSQMLKYNALDSAVTLACQGPIWNELMANGYEQTYNLSHQVLPVLIYISCRGIKVDADGLRAEADRVKQLIADKQQELNDEVGRPLNPNSPKQCQAYFYEELGIKPYTKQGKDRYGNRKQSITTDDKAMARLARGTSTRAPIKAAKLVQELRGLVKLSGTYLEVEFDSDGRLRCSVNPRGTKFGRLSTSETIFGTGTNMQNLPESFKKFLIADEGCMLYELDKSGAEWVVVAYLSGDAGMIDVCESGGDPHLHTAHLMFGVPKDIIIADHKALGHHSDPDIIKQVRSKFEQTWGVDQSNWIRNMSLRQAGKKSNHGLNYDEGFRTFALTNEILENDAKRIIAMYHDIYPGIRRMYDFIQNQLRHDRTLKNCFGRKYKFLAAWGQDLFKAAYAFTPQSTVVDLVNNSMAATYNDDTQFMEHSEILMQVHDSVLNQRHIKDDNMNFQNWALAIIRQADYMNPVMSYGGRDFQIRTDLKVGRNWGEMVEIPLTDNVNELADRLEEATCGQTL